MDGLLDIPITTGPVIMVFGALSTAFILLLVIRRTTRFALGRRGVVRWVTYLAMAVVVGALLAMSLLFLVETVFDILGAPMPNFARLYIILTFMALSLSLLNFWRSGWRRKVVAIVSILVFIITAALGINAAYGLNSTPRVLFGGSSSLPTTTTSRTVASVDPQLLLYESWTAPASMGSSGRLSSVVIPNTASGFKARSGLLYLPPAALVDQPPALPIIILMMGQPGGPEQSQILVPLLDAFAKRHNGLAPIVLTVDQLSAPALNPLCIDSKAGKVHSYILDDVVKFARQSLNTLQNRRFWAVGGYSNGGECALSFGTKHPDVFGALISIAGEIEPSLGTSQKTLHHGFDGDQARFDAEKPLTIAEKRRYDDMIAILTAGANDHRFSAQAKLAAKALATRGMTTHLHLQPGGDHGGDMIRYSFSEALSILAVRFGLEKPSR